MSDVTGVRSITEHPDYAGLMESAERLIGGADAQITERPRRQAAFVRSMDKVYRHWATLTRKAEEAEERAEEASRETVRAVARAEAAEASHKVEMEGEVARSAQALEQIQREADETFARLRTAHDEEVVRVRQEAGARLSTSEAARAEAEAGRHDAEELVAALYGTLGRVVTTMEAGNASMEEERLGMAEALEGLRRRAETNPTAPLRLAHVAS